MEFDAGATELLCLTVVTRCLFLINIAPSESNSLNSSIFPFTADLLTSYSIESVLDPSVFNVASPLAKE